MGFFSDLKEDLSQAVNELLPEDEQDIRAEEKAADTDMDVTDALKTEEAALEEKETEGALEQEEHTLDVDLEAMLNNMDKMDIEAMQMEDDSEKQDEQELETQESDEQELDVHDMDVHDMDVQKLLEKEFGEEETETTGSLKELETLLEENAVEEKIEEKGEAKRMEKDFNKAIADETSLITEKMVINGDMITEGSLNLLGIVNGNVEVRGKLNISGGIVGNSVASEIFADNAKITGEVRSDGAVKIGQSSVIIGDIYATSAVIAGAVKGDIDVKGPVVLDTSAIVMGNIKSKSVQINNGAVIEGMCSQCYAEVSPTSFFDGIK